MPLRSLAKEQGKTSKVVFDNWWRGDEVELADRLRNTYRTWEKVNEYSCEGKEANNGKGLSSSTHHIELSWWVWELTSLEHHHYGDCGVGGLVVMEAVCNR
jgi:hypothetical protein